MANQKAGLSREDLLKAIQGKIETDPQLRRDLRSNLNAAIDRAGLTEEVRRLREELVDDAEARCVITCGWTCSWTSVLEMEK